MMHYKVLAVLVLICAVQKSHATGTPPPACNGGSVQCCNSVQSATSPNVLAAIAGILGGVGPITGLVGLQCLPITGIGAGGQSCTNQAACCTGNSFNGGLVVVGCTPINLNG